MFAGDPDMSEGWGVGEEEGLSARTVPTGEGWEAEGRSGIWDPTLGNHG